MPVRPSQPDLITGELQRIHHLEPGPRGVSFHEKVELIQDFSWIGGSLKETNKQKKKGVPLEFCSAKLNAPPETASINMVLPADGGLHHIWVSSFLVFSLSDSLSLLYRPAEQSPPSFSPIPPSFWPPCSGSTSLLDAFFSDVTDCMLLMRPPDSPVHHHCSFSQFADYSEIIHSLTEDFSSVFGLVGIKPAHLESPKLVVTRSNYYSPKLKWTTLREVETQPQREKLETSVKILRAERQLKLTAEAETNFVELKQSEIQLKWAKYYLKIVFSRKVTKNIKNSKTVTKNSITKTGEKKHQNSEQRLKLANSS